MPLHMNTQLLFGVLEQPPIIFQNYEFLYFPVPSNSSFQIKNKRQDKVLPPQIPYYSAAATG